MFFTEKQRTRLFQALAPATASGILQGSRMSSEITLDEIFQIKNDKKFITEQLSQLRYYCGGMNF